MLTQFTYNVNSVNIICRINIDTSAMNKLTIKLLSGVMLFILLTGLVIYSRADISDKQKIPRLTVRVVAVEQQPTFTVQRFFPAIAEAQKSVAIGSEVAGKITKIHVDDGDYIEQGEPLFELDLQILNTQKLYPLEVLLQLQKKYPFLGL